MTKTILYIILPCYNEEEIINQTFEELIGVYNKLWKKELISQESRIVFVDDGSSDETWNKILTLKEKSDTVLAIKLAQNVGHQNAILAGLLTYKDQADCCITIDADLQDDITVIETMVKKYQEGNEIVYGVRNKRVTDTFFKKQTALAFYKLMKIMGVNIIFNHADYRLASGKALNELAKFKEVNLFLRSMFPLLGFKTTEVYYDRLKRIGGNTKFSLKKMLSFSLDGITSFSIVPLRLITFLGLSIFFFSLLFIVYAIYSYLVLNTIRGWASTALPIYFLGGIQLFCVGIIGEYIGKIYKEVKQRPRYIVEKTI
jgi:glycosyltransferase involved in cell wall biosynthesis